MTFKMEPFRLCLKNKNKIVTIIQMAKVLPYVFILFFKHVPTHTEDVNKG